MPELSTTQITEERLSSERNRLLFSGLSASVGASLILALLLVMVQWDHAGSVRSLTWLSAFVLVNGWRVLVGRMYVRDGGAVGNARRFEQRYVAGAGLGGAVWGLAPLLLFATDPAHQIFIAFVIAGVSAGAISTLGASSLAASIFLSLALLPLAARLFLMGGLLHVTMASMCILFLIFLIISAHRIASTLLENIQLRYQELGRQEALRRQADLLQRMGSIARIGTWQYHVESRAIRWSDELAAMYRLRPGEELTIDRALSAFPEPSRTELRNGIRRVIAEGITHESEQPMLSPTGRELWTRAIVEPLFENGVVSHIQGITQDVTEQRRVDVLKSEFVSTVSHELRTPLTSIRGAIGLIASGATGELPARAKTMLDIAVRNSERLIVLINDILDIEKIESGESDFSMVLQEVMPLVMQAIESTGSFAKDHAVHFTVRGDAHAMADVDAPRLVQVLINLLSNAAKFSPPDSEVVVDVFVRDAQVCVAVTDQGPGISADFLPRLFDKFSQADSSDQRKKGGTGLGLAISRVITETMGGVITVKTAPGAGSTFTVELPLVTASQSGSLALSDKRRPSVLLAPADSSDASRVRRILEDAGHHVVAAAQVSAISDHIAGDPSIGLCVLCISGYESHARWLRDWFRASRQVGSCPLVVVAHDASDRLLLGADLPIVDWLVKPAPMSSLSSALRAISRVDGEPLRILHVEDDRDLIHTVQELARDFATVESAGSVSDAKACIASRPFDLVLLDAALPDGSGLELLTQTIRAEPAPAVVIFTATNLSAVDAQHAASALLSNVVTEQRLLDVIESRISDVSHNPAGPSR